MYLKKILQKLFRKNKAPCIRNLYAITTTNCSLSRLMGQVVCIIEETETSYLVLCLPHTTLNVDIPKEEFLHNLSTNTVEYVRKCKRKVFKLLTAQFYSNQKEPS